MKKACSSIFGEQALAVRYIYELHIHRRKKQVPLIGMMMVMAVMNMRVQCHVVSVDKSKSRYYFRVSKFQTLKFPEGFSGRL